MQQICVAKLQDSGFRLSPKAKSFPSSIPSKKKKKTLSQLAILLSIRCPTFTTTSNSRNDYFNIDKNYYVYKYSNTIYKKNQIIISKITHINTIVKVSRPINSIEKYYTTKKKKLKLGHIS